MPADIQGTNEAEASGLGAYVYDGQKRAECQRGTRTGSRIRKLNCDTYDDVGTYSDLEEELTRAPVNQVRVAK